MYTKGKWKATKSGVGGRNWKIVAEVPETKTKTKHNVWIGTIYEKENAVGICQCVNNFDDLLAALSYIVGNIECLCDDEGICCICQAQGLLTSIKLQQAEKS